MQCQQTQWEETHGKLLCVQVFSSKEEDFNDRFVNKKNKDKTEAIS